MGVFKPHFTGAVVHQLHECRNSPRHPHSRYVGGVVAAGQQHTVDQSAQSDSIPQLQAHRRALDLHGLAVRNKGRIEPLLPQRYKRRHDLGGACHGKALFRIFAVKHVARQCINNDAALRRNRKPALSRCIHSRSLSDLSKRHDRSRDQG